MWKTIFRIARRLGRKQACTDCTDLFKTLGGILGAVLAAGKGIGRLHHGSAVAVPKCIPEQTLVHQLSSAGVDFASRSLSGFPTYLERPAA